MKANIVSVLIKEVSLLLFTPLKWIQTKWPHVDLLNMFFVYCDCVFQTYQKSKYSPESVTFSKNTTASAFLIGYSETNGQQSLDTIWSLKNQT